METPKQEKPEEFDIQKSPMKGAYIMLGANTPIQLSKRYTEEEQVLFRSHEWDYDNPEQVQNKVKNILEAVDESELTQEEKEWRNEILWFWYHHAISVSDWKRDKEKMQLFSSKALGFLQDNPNILTRTMYLLSHDMIEEAEQWVESKKGDDDEETAREMIANYKNIGWLWSD